LRWTGSSAERQTGAIDPQRKSLTTNGQHNFRIALAYIAIAVCVAHLAGLLRRMVQQLFLTRNIVRRGNGGVGKMTAILTLCHAGR
jgi:hypothetical protein